MVFFDGLISSNQVQADESTLDQSVELSVIKDEYEAYCTLYKCKVQDIDKVVSEIVNSFNCVIKGTPQRIHGIRYKNISKTDAELAESQQEANDAGEADDIAAMDEYDM